MDLANYRRRLWERFFYGLIMAVELFKALLILFYVTRGRDMSSWWGRDSFSSAAGNHLFIYNVAASPPPPG